MKEDLNAIDQACSEFDQLKESIKTKEHWLVNHAGVDSDMMKEVSGAIKSLKCEVASNRLKMLEAFEAVLNKVELMNNEMVNFEE